MDMRAFASCVIALWLKFTAGFIYQRGKWGELGNSRKKAKSAGWMSRQPLTGAAFLPISSTAIYLKTVQTSLWQGHSQTENILQPRRHILATDCNYTWGPSLAAYWVWQLGATADLINTNLHDGNWTGKLVFLYCAVYSWSFECAIWEKIFFFKRHESVYGYFLFLL